MKLANAYPIIALIGIVSLATITWITLTRTKQTKLIDEQLEEQSNVQIYLVRAEPERHIAGELIFIAPRRWGNPAEAEFHVGFDGSLKKVAYYEIAINEYRIVKPDDEGWNLWNNERWPEVRQEATTGEIPKPSQ